MNKQLIILVGNIGSGKTTLCKQYVKKKYSVVSRDGLRYMLGSGKYIFDHYQEKIVADTVVYITKQLMKKNVNIVIDEVNSRISSRKKYIKLAKQFNYKVIAVVLPKLTMKECVDRRMKDPHDYYDRKIWERVWKMFDTFYEIPDKNEGIDRIIKKRRCK